MSRDGLSALRLALDATCAAVALILILTRASDPDTWYTVAGLAIIVVAGKLPRIFGRGTHHTPLKLEVAVGESWLTGWVKHPAYILPAAGIAWVVAAVWIVGGVLGGAATWRQSRR